MVCAVVHCLLPSHQVDPSAQLHNIRNLQLYSYQYQHSAAKRMCCEPVKRHVGFIAQQVREVLPEAVKEVVSVGYRCVHADLGVWVLCQCGCLCGGVWLLCMFVGVGVGVGVGVRVGAQNG